MTQQPSERFHFSFALTMSTVSYQGLCGTTKHINQIFSVSAYWTHVPTIHTAIVHEERRVEETSAEGFVVAARR